MEYQIEGAPLPVVICQLEAGETMLTERGSMSWMTPNMYFTDAALQEYVAKCTKRAKPADNNLTYRKQHRPKKK